MSQAPMEIVGELLQNLLNPDTVRKLVAKDAPFVSLNFEDAELRKILPWAGISHGPEGFSEAISTIFRYWHSEHFEVSDMFGDGENVAVFGTFTYRSRTLSKSVTSPFSILAKVTDGKIIYLQFLEDTFATAGTFRSGGRWTVHADPDGAPFDV
jgi:uncharacterized protein